MLITAHSADGDEASQTPGTVIMCHELKSLTWFFIIYGWQLGDKTTAFWIRQAWYNKTKAKRLIPEQVIWKKIASRFHKGLISSV